jgi:hypothetical protein
MNLVADASVDRVVVERLRQAHQARTTCAAVLRQAWAPDNSAFCGLGPSASWKTEYNPELVPCEEVQVLCEFTREMT